MKCRIIQVTPDEIITVRYTPSWYDFWRKPFEVDYKAEHDVLFYRLPEVREVGLLLGTDLMQLLQEWRVRDRLARRGL